MFRAISEESTDYLGPTYVVSLLMPLFYSNTRWIFLQEGLNTIDFHENSKINYFDSNFFIF